ncbi:COQ9 family protein [Magnetospira thiophila]
MTRDMTDMLAIRDDIVEAMLPHVLFDGWSSRSMAAAVGDLKLDPSLTLRAFPGGLVEAVEHYCDWLDRRMMLELETRDLVNMRIRDRIATAVRVRLELVAPHRESVRRIVAFLSLPPHAMLAAKCTYRAVDNMWYAAGDTATDWNFYTKRGLLAGIYTSTLLYWLGDSSEGSEDTWGFLARRIDEVLRLPKLQTQAMKSLGRLVNPLKAFRLRRRRGFGGRRSFSRGV